MRLNQSSSLFHAAWQFVYAILETIVLSMTDSNDAVHIWYHIFVMCIVHWISFMVLLISAFKYYRYMFYAVLVLLYGCVALNIWSLALFINGKPDTINKNLYNMLIANMSIALGYGVLIVFVMYIVTLDWVLRLFFKCQQQDLEEAVYACRHQNNNMGRRLNNLIYIPTEIVARINSVRELVDKLDDSIYGRVANVPGQMISCDIKLTIKMMKKYIDVTAKYNLVAAYYFNLLNTHLQDNNDEFIEHEEFLAAQNIITMQMWQRVSDEMDQVNAHRQAVARVNAAYDHTQFVLARGDANV